MNKITVLFIILAITLTIFIAFTKGNTRILNNPDETEILQNNMTSESNTDVLNPTLFPTTVIVPEKYKTGAFKETRTLNMPEGYKIGVFISNLNNPRFLAFDDDDNVFVTDKGSGEVLLLQDIDGNNVADKKIVVDSGLRNIHGIDYYNGDLYVGEEHQVVVYKDVNNKGNYSTKQVLVDDLPSGNTLSQKGGHTTRTVKISPDEKLYVSIGSSCNVCEENDSRRAAMMRYDLHGDNQETYAKGLRNTVGFIFDANGNIWGVDNGRDLLGDDIPPDEINVIQHNKHYGWPYCYGQRLSDPDFLEKNLFCVGQTVAPVYELPAHSAPLGLSISKWTEYPTHLFIAYHGSWNRTTPTGYKIVSLDASSFESAPVNFITGWLVEDGTAWGRPVDVQFYQQDKMLITDDKSGSIYIVTKKL